MPMIPFAEWRPDMPELGEFAREALNVVPAEASYAPLNALTTVSDALGARPQGAAWFRAPDASTKIFAGDATKLYLLGTSSLWGDVSRAVGGPYTIGATDAWRFTQFGSLAIAVNGADTPQKFNMGSSTNFEVLGGTPPVGAFVATVRDFVVMGRIVGARNRIQWSGINNAELWGSVPVSQADYQDLPDGGEVTGLIGGETGVVLQESAVRRMTYEGSPIVFRIDKIANDIGCSVPGSVASALDVGFFLHQSGFYAIQGGAQITPIGRGKVNKKFWGEFDEANIGRVSSAIDPVRGLYIMSYPANSSDGTPNRLLIYNWNNSRWSRAELTAEYIFGGAGLQSYSLEDLDAFGDLETLPYSLDSSYWSSAQSLLLLGFNSDKTSGSFSGMALEAVCETGEFAPGQGRRATITSCRPLIDGGSPTIAIGARETQQAAVAYGSTVGLTPAGMAPVYTSGRYFRAKATVPAGSTWRNMVGIDDVALRVGGQQ